MPKMDIEDDNGGFEDMPSNPTRNIYDSVTNMRAVKTELLNAKDISYLGPVFIGSPRSQGAMVVYDTGSDWLTVKSCFTEQHCHMKIDQEATIAKLGEKAVKSLEDDDDEEDTSANQAEKD